MKNGGKKKKPHTRVSLYILTLSKRMTDTYFRACVLETLADKLESNALFSHSKMKQMVFSAAQNSSSEESVMLAVTR